MIYQILFVARRIWKTKFYLNVTFWLPSIYNVLMDDWYDSHEQFHFSVFRHRSTKIHFVWPWWWHKSPFCDNSANEEKIRVSFQAQQFAIQIICFQFIFSSGYQFLTSFLFSEDENFRWDKCPLLRTRLRSCGVRKVILNHLEALAAMISETNKNDNLLFRFQPLMI